MARQARKKNNKQKRRITMETKTVQIKPPNIKTIVFEIKGTAPLVVHRFSQKAQLSMLEKIRLGSLAKKGKKREAVEPNEVYNGARYISKNGWDGFNATGIRHALVSACRLVGFKMTLAKLSLFVVQDDWDSVEPQIPLIRIYGKPRRLDMWGRVETGQAYIIIRPCYDGWSAKVTLRYDADQFSVDDVANLLARAGLQVGICEGRPDSKNSVGMGWGTFEIAGKNSVK
jgi:hypothetical protein